MTITHIPPNAAKQRREAERFRIFVEENWTIREIDFAAGFHPAGTFHPHEDTDALVMRTKIESTADECYVERREPAVVNYAGFGFATWEEAKAFDKVLRTIQRDSGGLCRAWTSWRRLCERDHQEQHRRRREFGIRRDDCAVAERSRGGR